MAKAGTGAHNRTTVHACAGSGFRTPFGLEILRAIPQHPAPACNRRTMPACATMAATGILIRGGQAKDRGKRMLERIAK